MPFWKKDGEERQSPPRLASKPSGLLAKLKRHDKPVEEEVEEARALREERERGEDEERWIVAGRQLEALSLTPALANHYRTEASRLAETLARRDAHIARLTEQITTLQDRPRLTYRSSPSASPPAPRTSPTAPRSSPTAPRSSPLAPRSSPLAPHSSPYSSRPATRATAFPVVPRAAVAAAAVSPPPRHHLTSPAGLEDPFSGSPLALAPVPAPRSRSRTHTTKEEKERKEDVEEEVVERPLSPTLPPMPPMPLFSGDEWRARRAGAGPGTPLRRKV